MKLSFQALFTFCYMPSYILQSPLCWQLIDSNRNLHIIAGALSGNLEPKEGEKADDNTNGTTFRDCLTDEGTTKATQAVTEQTIAAQVSLISQYSIN